MAPAPNATTHAYLHDALQPGRSSRVIILIGFRLGSGFGLGSVLGLGLGLGLGLASGFGFGFGFGFGLEYP